MNAVTLGQSLTIRWRPELAYYPRRLDFMRVLDERYQDRAFFVTDDILRIMVASDHELVLEPDSLQLNLTAPDGDRQLLLNAASLAFESLAPQQINRVVLATQQVLPVDIDYTVLRQRGIMGLFPQSFEALALTDFAVLLDGSTKAFPGTFTMEFGIVAKDELPARLARMVGRIQRQGPSSSPESWATRDLPEVAVFADAVWSCPLEEPVSHVDSEAFWDAGLDEMSKLFVEVCDIVTATTQEEKSK